MNKPSLFQNEPYLHQGIWVRGLEEEYTIKEQNLYKNVSINEEDVVLDAGGHIGCSARYFIGRGAKAVYSFEPIDANFELLQKNSEGFNITPIKAALIPTNDIQICLYTPNTRFTTTHSVVNKRGRTPVMVPAVNFNFVVETFKPSVLKMDIEGAELDLTESFKNIHRYVRSIGMEVHYFTDGARKRARELKNILAANYSEIQPMKYLQGGWDRCIAVWERK